MGSDLDEELLGMAESRSDDGDKKGKKRRKGGGEPSAKRRKPEMSVDPDSTDEDVPVASKVDPDATESEPEGSGEEKEEGEADEEEDDDDDDDDDDEDDEDDDIESEDGDIKINKPVLKRSSSSKDKPRPSSSSANDKAAAAERDSAKAAAAAEAARVRREKAAASRAAAKAKKERAEKEKERKAKEREKEKAKRAKEKEKSGKGKKGSAGKYPLEGKYIDEADRAKLDQMPEMERELIITSRLEEMKDEEDAKRLELMYKQTVAAEKAENSDDSGSGEDMDMDIDDEDMGDGHIIEKPLEVARPAVSAKMAKLDKYNAVRESRAKKLANKTEGGRPNANRRLSDDEDSDGPSSEEGSITHEHRRRRSRDDHGDDYGGDRGRSEKKDKKQDSKPELPVAPGDMNAVRLSRYDLADYRYRAFFAEMATGAYVKCAAGVDDQRKTKYRIFEVLSVEAPAGTYNIEYKGQQVPDNRRLMLKYGSAKKTYRMSDVSNQDFTTEEFMRWQATMKADEQKLPVRSKMLQKHVQLREFRERPMTEADIQAKLTSMKNLGHTTGVDVSASRLRLRQDRGLAVRRGDDQKVRELDAKLAQMDYDIAVAAARSGNGGAAEVDHQAELLARVNEKNKRDGAQASKRAHKADIERRKVAEQVGMMDPSARVKSRLQQHTSDIPTALALLQAEESAALLGIGESSSAGDVVALGSQKPITDARRLEEAVAQAVELDLGDF